jgi:hypothetical protein
MDLLPRAWRDDLPPSGWGPAGWRWLHLEAINFPPRPKIAQKGCALGRLRVFVAHLPCPECRTHATVYLAQNPPDLSSSEAYQAWVFNFHNTVNARLRRPLFSYDDYSELYKAEIGWGRLMGDHAPCYRRA